MHVGEKLSVAGFCVLFLVTREQNKFFFLPLWRNLGWQLKI